MVPPCADNFEALQQFIDSQKLLLERTQSDIERLKKLKSDYAEDPDMFHELCDKLNDSAFKLSSRLDGWTNPPDLDWGIYAGRGKYLPAYPTPLTFIANGTRQTRPPPSELQILVRAAKSRIIDPVIDELTRSGCFDPDEGEEIDLNALKKELERERMMKLHKRKMKCGGLTISISARVPTDVVVRRDMEDESGLVDISLDDREPLSLASSPPPQLPPPPPPATKIARTLEGDTTNRRPSKKVKLKAAQEAPLSAPLPPPTTKRSRDAGKPKPETYKQAWSTSEQHLLEKLLEEIPEGAKNRWQKISQAMKGRRTPRQVASRVQKYFDKLKRFGVGVNSHGS
ncbi:hypothetical protein ONZ45_g14174 [Pleurotus djamor]|nr:hypothetical protein ONZ45_g14174 [Pleurotus djamor]